MQSDSKNIYEPKENTTSGLFNGARRKYIQ